MEKTKKPTTNSIKNGLWTQTQSSPSQRLLTIATGFGGKLDINISFGGVFDFLFVYTIYISHQISPKNTTVELKRGNGKKPLVKSVDTHDREKKRKDKIEKKIRQDLNKKKKSKKTCDFLRFTDGP